MPVSYSRRKVNNLLIYHCGSCRSYIIPAFPLYIPWLSLPLILSSMHTSQCQRVAYWVCVEGEGWGDDQSENSSFSNICGTHMFSLILSYWHTYYRMYRHSKYSLIDTHTIESHLSSATIFHHPTFQRISVFLFFLKLKLNQIISYPHSLSICQRYRITGILCVMLL